MFHSFLAWFFRRFANSLDDGGFELVIRSSNNAQRNPILLSYFAGWVPYPGYDINQVYVLLYVLGRTYSLYSVNLEYHEHPEFPRGEFPEPWWYERAEDDFWVRGVDHQVYPEHHDPCNECPYEDIEDCSSFPCPAPETIIVYDPR